MREMNIGRSRSPSPSPEPLDFFIWTVEDVGLWLEEINLGGYHQVFKEHGINGEYLESMSTFTTEQILRFIRRCHMKWGDFITLCKELRRIKGGTEGASAVVGSVLLLSGLRKCSEAQQKIESRLAEAGTMKLTYPPETVIRECYFHPKQEHAKNRRLV